MKYGLSIIILLLFIIILLGGCSPTYRFTRLVSKYPYLIETLHVDSVHIRDTLQQDTQFVWSEKIDTITIDNIRIARVRDTFRVVYREKPCTTYVQTTEIKPSKIVEKYIEQKEKTGFFGAIHKIKEWLWLIPIFILIILLIRK